MRYPLRYGLFLMTISRLKLMTCLILFGLTVATIYQRVRWFFPLALFYVRDFVFLIVPFSI